MKELKPGDDIPHGGWCDHWQNGQVEQWEGIPIFTAKRKEVKHKNVGSSAKQGSFDYEVRAGVH